MRGVTKYRFLILVVWLFGTTLVQANTGVSDPGCFQTNSTLIDAQLLPFMHRHAGSSDAIKLLGLNARQDLTETTRNPTTPSLAKSDDLELFDDTKSDQWFQFCLHNPSNLAHQLVVKVGPATLSEIDFYPQKTDLPFFRTGSIRGINTRDIPISGYGFKVSLAPNERQTFYLRINATDNPFYRRTDIDENPFFLVTIWDRDSFDVDNNKGENLFGIIVGVFLALAVYHLLLFILARQWTSVLYIAVISCIFVVLLSLNGRVVQLLPPNYSQFSNLAIAIFYPLSLFFAAFFFKAFINLKDYSLLNLIGNILLGVSALILLVSFMYSQAVYAQLCDLVAIIITIYFGLYVPIYTFIKDRLVVAKYMLITLTPLIFCLVDRALFSFGVTDQYHVPYKIVTAAMFTMVVISYYMGLIAYREKQAAQRTALEQLHISDTLKSNYNKQLEDELEQKTTDIRLMNADLEHKANKLLQLDESKSRFFANISHEFRTPLTLIEGPLTMLLEQKDFHEKGTIEGVLRNSNSLKNLIDQILLLSELDEKSLDLSVSEINVVQAVSEFSAQFASLAEQKGVELRCDADQPTINAYVDYEKLQIVINNLLSNAIKFTESGGQIIVEISSTVPCNDYTNEYSRDEYIKIVVSDTGSGIPESELPFVFDRYFQSDSSELSKSGVGTGIGLALVKELVELHAGDVSVFSAGQKGGDKPSGTSFTVNLPLGRAHFNDNEIAANTEAVYVAEKQENRDLSPSSIDESHSVDVADGSKKQRATVLIVDDNDDMRRYIQRLLNDDYNVVTAQDGLLAEAELSNQVPDLIVTDLMMPNRNGLEFVQSIKSNPELANIPVIMLTARAGLHDRLKGLMAAVDDYLVKPFDGRELKVRVHNLLNKHAQFSAFYRNQASGPETELNKQDEAYIDKVEAVVNQKLMDPDFGVDELAKALHVSEATLRRRLSNNANYTPAAFIRHCRLEKARQLSMQGNMRSMSELANAVGFSKPSYFARLYQKTFNCEVNIHSNPEPD